VPEQSEQSGSGASAEYSQIPPDWLKNLGVQRVSDLGDAYQEALSAVRLTVVAYGEARAIGELLRSGQSVLVDLRSLDNAEAKRIVDFSAGLAFGLRGSIRRVANRVILLHRTEGSAEERPNNRNMGLTPQRVQSNEDRAAEVKSVLDDLARVS